MKRKQSLGRQILRAMFFTVFGALLAAGIIFVITIKNMSGMVGESNTKLTDLTGKKSSASMAELTERRLLELATGKADIADGLFVDFERGVSEVAAVASLIYEDPEAYSARQVDLPDLEKDGELSVQVLYSKDTDPEDPEIIEELGLLGNVQDSLVAVNANMGSVASVYVATESGFMVQADYISSKKFDENGELMPLEAKERPWYQGASRTRGVYLTSVTKDAHTPRLGIMCGVPVYAKGALRGVAGAGMYLDDMEKLIKDVDLGENGRACIINKEGQVQFSTFEKGVLSVQEEGVDLRESEDEELAALVKKALAGRIGVTLLSIDQHPSYVAYAPLSTVGWSMMVILTQREVEAPTDELLKSLDAISSQTWKDANNYVRHILKLLAALFAVAILIVIGVSILMTRRIVKPITALTDSVKAMEGDNLEFTWTPTNQSETEMLAESFQSLTERIKNYIQDLKSITAERERITTELALAQRIQSSSLPTEFPPFPDRPEFDIYAMMDPAREVGGDFYDFFLIDDDHLCLVIADVSGKGIPAALFMMVSKTVLETRAKQDPSPSAILAMTNDVICSNNPEDMFITVWIGILEISTGKLTAANAGHEYPVLRKPGGNFELLKDKHGFVIGGYEDLTYKDYEIQMEPGSKLFLYTDGLPEAKGIGDNDEMFGTERMLDALNTVPEETPAAILRMVNLTVQAYVQSAEQFDDLTMLCLEYKGTEDQPE